jgi:hypothetical protein
MDEAPPPTATNDHLPGGMAMQALERVLAQRTGELVEILVQRADLSRERAERFVSVAGPDVVASFRWQVREAGPQRLGAPSTARNVLNTMGATRIAVDLGMTRAEVWVGLRTLVPGLLRMAGRAQAEYQASSTRPFPWVSSATASSKTDLAGVGTPRTNVTSAAYSSSSMRAPTPSARRRRPSTSA